MGAIWASLADSEVDGLETVIEAEGEVPVPEVDERTRTIFTLDGLGDEIVEVDAAVDFRSAVLRTGRPPSLAAFPGKR